MELAGMVTLAQATKLLPFRPDVSTLWRWCRKGVAGVRLPYVKAGRRLLISPSDLQTFCEQLAAADRRRDECHDRGTQDKPHTRSAGQRERDIARAEARLREAGVLTD